MQTLLNNVDITEEIADSTIVPIPENQAVRPMLHMKWEKEFDGKRYNLVARWVVED